MVDLGQTITLAHSTKKRAESGASNLALLPSFPEGEIVHAVAAPNTPSDPGVIDGFAEFFYILEGTGELWRSSGGLESVTPLMPRRCVTIPPGIEYQCRAGDAPMTFLVATAPRFEKARWRPAGRSYWDAHGKESNRLTMQGPWTTADLATKYNYLAPDGSEIRLLPAVDAGGLCHCTLPAGAVSAPVRHRTVKEIWYILAGEGEMWRGIGDESEIRTLQPDVCLTIPTGVSFQFRGLGHGPLSIMIGTFPAWPGPQEAEPVKGKWKSTA